MFEFCKKNWLALSLILAVMDNDSSQTLCADKPAEPATMEK